MDKTITNEKARIHMRRLVYDRLKKVLYKDIAYIIYVKCDKSPPVKLSSKNVSRSDGIIKVRSDRVIEVGFYWLEENIEEKYKNALYSMVAECVFVGGVSNIEGLLYPSIYDFFKFLNS